MLIILLALLGVMGFEAWRAVRFYHEVSSARTALLVLRSELNLDSLHNSPEQIQDIRARLDAASAKLRTARRFVDSDPLLFAASLVPFVGKNATSLRYLVHAADDSAKTGLLATDVLSDYDNQQEAPGSTSIQNGMAFLQSQEGNMARVEAGLGQTRRARSKVASGWLFGPLERARSELDDALGKLSGLVEGYDRADKLLPTVLGYNGPKRYLVLPENNTELFPSGGLISNYGVATFDRGKLGNISFEYFVNLFDRWQAESGGEYVEPPAPLKNYLLHNVSWGLGEAGWYPDFPTTAKLAASFTEKGGVPPTDGTIAIDLRFVAALLGFLGPLKVQAYGVTVDAKNLSEVTLEETRGESSLPGTPGKSFLSALASGLLTEIFNTPKEKWVELLKLLDSMARQRHLQMNFADPKLQALARDYGLDGGIVTTSGDYLLVADTSVHSTKLNLILESSIKVSTELSRDGSASTVVTYAVKNPLPEWSKGQDPKVVHALMLDGLYGSYVRLYVAPEAHLQDVEVDGTTVGAEEVDGEMGHEVFGRFFAVPPGDTGEVQFRYTTASVVKRDGNVYRYSLYVEKEAGTGSIPLVIKLTLPEGSNLVRVALDGTPVASGGAITTDLKTDRRIEVEFRKG